SEPMIHSLATFREVHHRGTEHTDQKHRCSVERQFVLDPEPSVLLCVLCPSAVNYPAFPSTDPKLLRPRLPELKIRPNLLPASSPCGCSESPRSPSCPACWPPRRRTSSLQPWLPRMSQRFPSRWPTGPLATPSSVRPGSWTGTRSGGRC